MRILMVLLLITGVYADSLAWDRPTQRVNGDALHVNEIGGYELALKCELETEYRTYIIEDNTATEYNIDGIALGQCFAKMAAFDIDGLYSKWSEELEFFVIPLASPIRFNDNIIHKIGDTNG